MHSYDFHATQVQETISYWSGCPADLIPSTAHLVLRPSRVLAPSSDALCF